MSTQSQIPEGPETAAVRLLANVLQSDVGKQTLQKLTDGQGTDTEEGRAWLSARDFLASYQQKAAPPSSPLLAAPHQGMRVHYSGMLKQAGHASTSSGETFHEFMLLELARNMAEMGQRYYAGDVAAVDEFLQLYCVAKEERDALVAQPAAHLAPRDRPGCITVEHMRHYFEGAITDTAILKDRLPLDRRQFEGVAQEYSRPEVQSVWFGFALGMRCAERVAVELEARAATAKAPFQLRVQPWLLACFGAEIAGDKVERNHRFLEEALELVQSCGCTQSEAHQLVDYVFGRPVGEPRQETGGVMVTLAALCLAQGLNMHEAGEAELARIWTMVEKIRAKQAAKPKHGPLPEAPSTSPATMPQVWSIESGYCAGEKDERYVSIRHLDSQCGQDFYKDRDPLIFGFLSALAEAQQQSTGSDPNTQEP